MIVYFLSDLYIFINVIHIFYFVILYFVQFLFINELFYFIFENLFNFALQLFHLII